MLPPKTTSSGSTPKKRKAAFDLRPVAASEYGEGLPYAPVDWPEPGDVWGWRAGSKIGTNGFHCYRYLYLPSRLCQLESSKRKRLGFASKQAIEKYLRTAHPRADVQAFFDSFSWEIRGKEHSSTRAPTPKRPDSNLLSDVVACKAGNTKCPSLLPEAVKPEFPPSACDICCSECGFCRYCCCILCCKTITLSSRDHSYIRCEAKVDDCYVRGHVAHVDCALRCCMAGVGEGNKVLDSEYYCRRCDSRTDLLPHVKRLFKTCESIQSPDSIEQLLNTGISILRGSQKNCSKTLLHLVESAITKLKCGTLLQDTQKLEDGESVTDAGVNQNDGELKPTAHQEPSSDSESGQELNLSIISVDHNGYLRIENRIERVLHALRKSQESEYKAAEEKLNAQKNHLHTLFLDLEKERSQLSEKKPVRATGALMNAVLNKADQIKQEIMKLKEMEEVANGFGRTPRHILKEHFGVEIKDSAPNGNCV